MNNFYQNYTYTSPGEPIWVQGEEGARSYNNILPGKSAILMDSENPVFYWKSVDQSGMPQPLRKFKFEEIKEEHPKYVTMDDVKKYLDEVLKKNESTVQQ